MSCNMRRVLLMLLIIAMLLLVSCKPSGMSDEAYKLGIRALDIVDKYINIDIISTDKALEQLEEIHDRLGNMYDNDESLKTFIVKYDIGHLIQSMKSGDDDKILNARNELAKDLNRGTI